MRKRKPGTPEADTRHVVRLEDLAPRSDVRGGAGKVRFGERLAPPAEAGASPPPAKGPTRSPSSTRTSGKI